MPSGRGLRGRMAHPLCTSHVSGCELTCRSANNARNTGATGASAWRSVRTRTRTYVRVVISKAGVDAMCRSYRSLIRAALILVVVLAPHVSHADTIQCERAISVASARYARFSYQARRRCYDAVLKGSQPGPCPDARASTKLATLNASLHTRIAANCGGPNHQCGDGDDQPLSTIGWNIGTCPNFENGSCTNAIANCTDIADCLSCVGTAVTNQAIALTYGGFNPSPPNAGVVKCQRVIGKRTEKFFSSQTRSLQKCENRVLFGFASGPCPDPIAAQSIAKAEARKVKAICKACGGPDRTCGTGDDVSASDVGFASTCPSVTIPRGNACAAPVLDMQDIVECVDCVDQFKADCADAVAVPALTTYPAECNGGISATATPTPSPATPTATATLPVPTPTVAGPTITLPLPTQTLLVTPTLPLPSITLPLPTATSTPATTATPTATVTLPLPTITLPLPTITLPLPTITLPLPTITLPLPTTTTTLPLPIATITLPLPSATITLPLPSATITLPLPSATITLP